MLVIYIYNKIMLSTNLLELVCNAIKKSHRLALFQELILDGGEGENIFFGLLLVFVDDDDRRDAVVQTGLGLGALEQVSGHAAGEAEALGEASVAADASVLGFLDDLGGRRLNHGPRVICK